jgi:hypothetical protein
VLSWFQHVRSASSVQGTDAWSGFLFFASRSALTSAIAQFFAKRLAPKWDRMSERCLSSPGHSTSKTPS